MIYAPPTSSTLEPGSSSRPFGNAAFALERAACGTFGLPTYGVHMTGELPSTFSVDRDMMILMGSVRRRGSGYENMGPKAECNKVDVSPPLSYIL